jgi:glycosyltransferase involved in cell wall biosynthesis
VKKLLFTICSGDVAKRQYAVTGECFEAYAKRHGYDYHCITDVSGYREPHYAKTHAVKAIQDGYDCVVYFDVDGVLNIDAPDIAAGKSSGLWLYNELDLVESYNPNAAIRNTFSQYCKEHGVTWNVAHYYNSGVFVLFPDDVCLLDIGEMEPGVWCHEQHCINMLIVKHPELIRALPSRWNYHRLQFPDRLSVAFRGEPWYSHFAGLASRGNDDGIKKMKQVKQRYSDLAAMPSQVDQPWEVFNPPADNVVGNRCCMITVAIGTKLKWMFDITLASQKAYCERHGITHIIVDELWRRGDEHPCMMKQRTYELLLSKQFDRACYADADIWISQNAPNIFDEVPRGKLGQYEEGCHWRPNVLGDLFIDFADYADNYNEHMQALDLEQVDMSEWDQTYYNAGLFVCELDTCPHIPPVGDIMHLPHRKRLARGGDFYDQHYVNLMRIKHKMPMHSLSAKWDMFRGMLDAMPYKIEDCYFIHYCGDDAQKKKILTDIEALKVTKKRIHIVSNNNGWILDKMSDALEQYAPDGIKPTRSNHPIDDHGVVNFFNNYRLYNRKSKRAKDVVFFTHPEIPNQWKEGLKNCDHAIVMCNKYHRELIDMGLPRDRVTMIHPGVDDCYMRRKLRVFIPSRILANAGYKERKGYKLWQRLSTLDWLECITSDGMMTPEQVLLEYERANVIVSTATMEGGPMSVVEAIALNKPILARAGVGMVDDYEAVIAYKDDDDLIRMLQRLWDARQLGLQDVYGWDVWAAKHYDVFRRVAECETVEAIQPIEAIEPPEAVKANIIPDDITDAVCAHRGRKVRPYVRH